MLVNMRKIRLFALSSIVCQKAGPPCLTLRARRICPLSALGRLENRTVTGAYLPAQTANPAAQNGWN
jgi:hypothetical protein